MSLRECCLHASEVVSRLCAQGQRKDFLTDQAYRIGRDGSWYGSSVFHAVARHSFPSKRMRLSPQDVAFMELVVFATLRNVSLLGLEDLETTYDNLVREAVRNCGKWEVQDDSKRVTSILEIRE